MKLEEPEILLLACAALIAETVVVGVTIVLCQPAAPAGATAKGSGGGFATGEVRRAGGYFSRFGGPLGWLLCFFVMAGLTALTLVPYGKAAAVGMWWVTALMLFGLTVRQTLKLNVALALLHIALLTAVGAGRV